MECHLHECQKYDYSTKGITTECIISTKSITAKQNPLWTDLSAKMYAKSMTNNGICNTNDNNTCVNLNNNFTGNQETKFRSRYGKFLYSQCKKIITTVSNKNNNFVTHPHCYDQTPSRISSKKL